MIFYQLDSGGQVDKQPDKEKAKQRCESLAGKTNFAALGEDPVLVGQGFCLSHFAKIRVNLDLNLAKIIEFSKKKIKDDSLEQRENCWNNCLGCHLRSSDFRRMVRNRIQN